MIKPKVSIITATHYRPDLLARCIKSVQNSTLQEYEHIIVSDHCPKAHQVYQLFKDDKRIKFFETEDPHMPNHGARAQNLGIQKSQSDVICYCNDDNIVLSNHLQIMHESLSSGEYDLVYSKTHEVRIGRGNNMIKRIVERDFSKDLEPEKNIRAELMYSDPKDMSNMGHTKRILQKSGVWRLKGDCPSGIEDTDFMDRVEKATNKILNVPIYTSLYYVRGACFVPDTMYHQSVVSLSEEQTFVYHKILKETGVLND